jgi:hypothetical protein
MIPAGFSICQATGQQMNTRLIAAAGILGNLATITLLPSGETEEYGNTDGIRGCNFKGRRDSIIARIDSAPEMM